MKKIAITMLLVLSLVIIGMATVYAKMEEPVNIRCTFLLTQFYSITNGKAEIGTTEKFEFVIKGINTLEPLLVGDTGTSILLPFPSSASETIYLIEHTPFGNINYITIFPRMKRIIFIKGYGHMGNMWSQTSIGLFEIIK